jgi:hypothetical protein
MLLVLKAPSLPWRRHPLGVVVRIRRWAAIAAASIVTIGGLAVAAAPAVSADQVWHQAVGRGSADAACPTNTPEETAAGWTQWAGSWEKWMNGQTGGFVCQRDITWAKDSAPPVTSDESRVACEAWMTPDLLLKFDGVVALREGTQMYSDVDCTTLSDSYIGYWAVYANTMADAQDICDTVDPEHSPSKLGGAGILGPRVWACIPFGL